MCKAGHRLFRPTPPTLDMQLNLSTSFLTAFFTVMPYGLTTHPKSLCLPLHFDHLHIYKPTFSKFGPIFTFNQGLLPIFEFGSFCPFLGPKLGVQTETPSFALGGFAHCCGKRAGQTTEELESQAVVAGRRGAWWHPKKIPSSNRKPMLRQTVVSTTSD